MILFTPSKGAHFNLCMTVSKSTQPRLMEREREREREGGGGASLNSFFLRMPAS